ncbi:MAG TPA: amino acid adenylation domain-containing protein [Chthoniobacteraceae bacterium]|jgi:amino acid adenylation domain-containing protein|nr:amino acid adenylation domain-containing protein [Chthoniobacteraceae bacterium]
MNDLAVLTNEMEESPEPAERDAWIFPTSFAQRRLWFLDQMEPGNTLYNVPGAFRIRGRLNPAALEHAFKEAIARHEVLRTTFRAVEGEPMQIVAETMEFHMPVIDLRPMPAAAREAQLLRIVREESERPFDLRNGPLIRAALLEIAPAEQVLVLSWHHIITDSWSQDILMRELTSAYSAATKGGTLSLPELPIQYADFAAWQRDAMQGETLDRELGYWRERLTGLPALDLPRPSREAAARAPEGATHCFEIDPQLTAAVRAMAQREGVTLFMALLTAWKAFLARYTAQTDIAVGSPISDRGRTETEGLIGFFLNTLVLRTDLAGNPTGREALLRVRDTALEAFAHQDLPFEMMVEEVQPARQQGRNPLLRVMFVLMTGAEKTWRTPDAEIEPLPIEESKAKFDLMLHLRDNGETIKSALVYDTALYYDAAARRMAAQFQTLLAGMTAHPESPIESLPLILPEERERILTEWNGASAPWPAGSSVHALFRQQVQLNPDAIAIEDGALRVTYAELDRQADAIAGQLIQEGVKPGDAVAITLPRSASLIAGILGILKAGGAYVPLDVSYPAARLALMLRESGARILLGAGERPELETMVRWLPIEAASQGPAIPPVDVPSDSPAYIMFTSGSTGVPKGVRVLHRGITRLVINTNYVEFLPADIVAHASNTSFDAATFEIWGALLNGGRLLIVPKETLLSPQELVSFIRARKVSMLFLTTPLFHHFAREIPDGFGTLRYLVAGGDALQPQAARAVLEAARPAHLVNGYGPTEVTTFAICHEVTDVPADAVTVPIGRPISNTRAYILDAAMQPVPAGIAGELYLGGPGVAGGYVNNTEGTTASFIPDPFSTEPEDRLYRTGDLARWRDDGVIEFLGRADNQVKIRGFRIEPGEIETVLQKHPGVRHAIVIPRADATGQKQLAAYVVPQPGRQPTSGELREHILASLPEYMAPGSFAFLDKLPLNANGKVDTQALAAQPLIEVKRSHAEPGTWMEATLVQIWEELLDCKPVGVTDDFFELGGHSLLAIRMLSEVEKRTGVRITPRLLFEQATIRHIAQVVQAPSPVVRVQSEGSKPPFIYFHGDFLFGGLYLVNLAKYLPKDRPCIAIEPHGYDGAKPPPTIEEMAVERLKTVLDLQPDGPYYLGGFCNGGLVAFHVAQLLRAQGKEVACLVLLGANGINAQFRNLKRLANFVARIRGLDAGASRELFLKWRERSLFGGLLVRHHLKELTPRPSLLWRKARAFARWVSRLAGLSSSLTPSAAAAAQTIEEVSGKPPIWNIYSDAVAAYVPPRYDGKLNLIRETELPPELAWLGNDLAWNMVGRSLSIHKIPGGHFTITEHSNIRIFAEQLKLCLEEVEAERPPAAR